MEKMDGQVRGTCSAGTELTQGPSTCCVPRPGFSKNSPVWLLGCAYHRKLVEGPGGGEGGGSPVGGQVTTFTETDSGIEAFEKDYRSKVRRVSSQLVSLCPAVDVLPAGVRGNPRHQGHLGLWLGLHAQVGRNNA